MITNIVQMDDHK